MTINKEISVYIDVDGTLLFWDEKPGRMPRGVPREELHKRCALNTALINKIKEWKSEGRFVVLWSRGGRRHALWAGEFAGIDDIIDAFLPKPDYLIDDGRKNWNRHLIIVDQNLNEI